MIYDSKHKHQELHTSERTIVPRTVIFFSVVVSCPENADFAFAKFEFDSTLVTEWNWVSTVMILMTSQLSLVIIDIDH